MADGSRLPFDENLALVAEAPHARRRASAPRVEAELGHVAGGEDVAVATEAGGLTDPDEARASSRRAGADLLAVSIGNVHGKYAGEPRLDWERLAAVEAAVDMPLSLHGASGLADADVRRAVAGGIRKANANTELRAAYLEATSDGPRPRRSTGCALMQLHDAQARRCAPSSRKSSTRSRAAANEPAAPPRPRRRRGRRHRPRARVLQRHGSASRSRAPR